MRFRKRPVEIDAVQWTGKNRMEVRTFLNGDRVGGVLILDGEGGLVIETLEGAMIASAGDWIIRGVQGEYYPCKPDIFKMTYEPVEDFYEDDEPVEDVRAAFDAAEKAVTRERICGRCREPLRGYASRGDTWLCHPDDGLDCYRLVTVYKHPTPCFPRAPEADT